MSSTAPQQPTYIIPPPSAPNWKTPVVACILVLLAATNVYLFVQLERLRADGRTEMAKLRDDLSSTVERMRVDSSEAVQRSRRSVEALQTQLQQQRRMAERAVGQAKVDAEKRVDELNQRVAAEQAAEQQAITQVKQTADAATTKLTDVSSDVQNTKTQLEQTIANLKRATGELDSHASLIATNGKELQALRELGERNYAEFTITKSKQPTRVGNVMIMLKKVDVKRNKFTIAVTADDKTVERKDRSINEPIQFYTQESRQPDEIVVNAVKKDAIVGYLATPKVQSNRAAAS
ncbi:MAG: hypothetical protein JOZ62_16525 [Acidobacteriaceae bacterium]|nr:hypothetical protein [Acidobacteriaceae bacterium]